VQKGWQLGSAISAEIFPFLRFQVDSLVGSVRTVRTVARSQASGDEMVRLLNILADCLNGATPYELTVLDGVNDALIYQAIELDLINVELDSRHGMATYRFHIAAAGRKLLRSGSRNDENSSQSPSGD
jgi:hypothetical protein